MARKKIHIMRTPEQIVARQKKLEEKQANAAKPLKINMSFGDAIKKVVNSKKRV
jgi:hypothetical protein